MTSASVGFQCPECIREAGAAVPAPRRASPVRAAGRRWGPVTLTLIGLNVAVFLATAGSASIDGFSPLDNEKSSLFADLQLAPVLVQYLGEDWRLITSAFLHIGPVHLLVNMLTLLIFGSEMERVLGRWRFSALYLLSAVGGSVAVELFGAPDQAVAGASAAIYGLFGGLFVVFLASRQDLRGILALLAINLAVSFFPGISLLGHLGGLVAGLVTGAILALTRRRTELQVLGLLLLTAVLVITALTATTIVVLDI